MLSRQEGLIISECIFSIHRSAFEGMSYSYKLTTEESRLYVKMNSVFVERI